MLKITKHQMNLIESALDYGAMDSDIFLRLFNEFYLSFSESKQKWIESKILNKIMWIHDKLFYLWIRKKRNQYYTFLQSRNNKYQIFEGNSTIDNGTIHKTSDCKYLEREMKTVFTWIILFSICHDSKKEIVKTVWETTTEITNY